MNVVIPIPEGADELVYTAHLQKLSINLAEDNLKVLAEKSYTVPDVNKKIRQLLKSFGHLIK